MKVNAAIGQMKPFKGDYQRNLSRLGDLFEQLEEESPHPDILALPETALSGYFLEGGVRDIALPREVLFADLLRTFRERVLRTDAALDICLGFYELSDGKYYNSALYATLTKTDSDLIKAQIIHVHRKFFLPTYGVFDEKRFVSRGRTIEAFPTRFGIAAVLICEDVWHSISATIAALQGAQTIFVLSASPGRDFGGQHVGSVRRWNVLLPSIADEHNVWVIYAGLVGFEGGKGFTGSSQVIDPWGNCLITGPVTEDCIVCAAMEQEDVAIARAASPLLSDLEAALGDITLQLEKIERHPLGTGNL